jgi:two-component system, OmpR family, sensor kinase
VLVWSSGLLSAALVCAIGVAFRYRSRNAVVEQEMRRLRRLAERRADQVSALSHEIRTPLAMIKGASDLLGSEAAGPLNANQREFIGTISYQSEHVIGVAEGLLLQARIDAGLFDLRVSLTDVRPLVRSTVKGMRTLCDARRQIVQLHCPPRIGRIPADPKLVRQALINVLQNASRFTSQGGSIELRVLDNDDAVVFAVIDDGAGMTADERKNLFQKFASGRPLGDGTGLGMLINKQIVELHGGHVLVETQLHRGTTVMMSFPKTRGAATNNDVSVGGAQ